MSQKVSNFKNMTFIAKTRLLGQSVFFYVNNLQSLVIPFTPVIVIIITITGVKGKTFGNLEP